MSISKSINLATANELYESWGERWPTWDEFKMASKQDRVRVNKTIATQLSRSPYVPLITRVLYSMIFLWIAFLSLPVTFFLWLFFGISAWWILLGGAIGWFLIKVCREGHCLGITMAAENHEQFYYALVKSGAFLFKPK